MAGVFGGAVALGGGAAAGPPGLPGGAACATAKAKAQTQANDQEIALNNTEAKGTYEVAMAKADGTHQIALEKCTSLSGDARSRCKDQADADYAALPFLGPGGMRLP